MQLVVTLEGILFGVVVVVGVVVVGLVRNVMVKVAC